MRLATGTVRCVFEFSSTNINAKHFERSSSFPVVQNDSTAARLGLGEKKWNFNRKQSLPGKKIVQFHLAAAADKLQQDDGSGPALVPPSPPDLMQPSRHLLSSSINGKFLIYTTNLRHFSCLLRTTGGREVLLLLSLGQLEAELASSADSASNQTWPHFSDRLTQRRSRRGDGS